MTPGLDELLAHLPEEVRAELIASVAELKAQGWSDERIAEILPALPPDEAGSAIIPYCQWIDPEYSDPPHIRLLADALHQVQRYVETRGREGIGRLIVNLPPRTGKSLTVSKRFPAFLLGQHPDWRIALIGYNDEFAADFSRAVRAQCSQYERTDESERYHLVFPEINVNPASSAVGRWALANRSADDPSVVAAGINGSLVGRGFHVIVIDDPVKNRIEAESPAYREQLKSQYKGTIRTRLEPGGAIIVCATRWHEDDLPGWLIAQEKIGGEHYHVINIPALIEDEEDKAGDPLGRDIGESIWPERLPVHELLALKAAVMDYEWASQYKGRPKPSQGGLIPRSYFAGKILPMLPDKFRSLNGAPPAERLKWVRYWDLAVSTAQQADYFASARLAFDSDENLYVADMVRDKLEWPDQREVIKGVMLSELELGTHHYIEEAMHGQAAVQDFLRDKDLRRVPIEGVKVDKDKRIRAMPFITRAKAGKVYLIAGAWVQDFLNEASNFTGSGKDAHDDQIDTCSGGVAAAKPTAQTDLLEYMRRRMARRAELEGEKKKKAGQTDTPATEN